MNERYVRSICLPKKIEMFIHQLIERATKDSHYINLAGLLRVRKLRTSLIQFKLITYCNWSIFVGKSKLSHRLIHDREWNIFVWSSNKVRLIECETLSWTTCEMAVPGAEAKSRNQLGVKEGVGESEVEGVRWLGVVVRELPPVVVCSVVDVSELVSSLTLCIDFGVTLLLGTNI